MVGAAITESFDAGFDGAQSEGLVRMRFERVADDVRAVELEAGWWAGRRNCARSLGWSNAAGTPVMGGAAIS